MKRLTRAETLDAYNFMLDHRGEFEGGTAEEAATILTARLKRDVTAAFARELAETASITFAEAKRPKKTDEIAELKERLEKQMEAFETFVVAVVRDMHEIYSRLGAIERWYRDQVGEEKFKEHLNSSRQKFRERAVRILTGQEDANQKCDMDQPCVDCDPIVVTADAEVVEV